MMIALVALVTALIGVCDAVSRPDFKPHVVVFVIDDLGWSDVSYREGVDDIHTPTIDALAKDGVVLDSYYVQPVCSPSRAALLQGRFPFKTGLQHFDTIMPTSYAAMPLNMPTLAEQLSMVGYKSAAVGKWHVGYASWKNTPTYRGFWSHTGYFQGEIDYYMKNFTIPKRFLPWPKIQGIDWWKEQAPVKDDHTYNKILMDQAATEAINNHKKDPEAPLFLYYAHQVAHVPLEVPDKWLANCGAIKDPKRHTYCGMLAAVDDSLRLVVDELKSQGMWDDTILVVTTDNGGMPNVPETFPPSAGVNFPLRAGKGTVFEGGVRGVAFVNGGKNVLPPTARGRVVTDSLTHVVDWFPTLTNLGQAGPVPDGVDGKDLWDTLTGPTQLDRTSLPLNINWNLTFPSSGHQVGILTNDGWKLLLDAVEGKVLNYDGWFPAPPAVVQEAPSNPTPGKFLFNLKTDPGEHNNLYASNPAKVKELEAILAEYMKDYVVPQPNSIHLAGMPELHGGVWAPFLDKDLVDVA